MDKERGAAASVVAVVGSARRRLRRVAGRRAVLRRGGWVFAASAVVAGLRPVLWPLGDEATLADGIARAALMAVTVSVIGFAGVWAWGRRRVPAAVAAARVLDAAGGHPEVIASAWAFERDQLRGPFVALALARAEAAAEVVDVAGAIPLPSLLPRRRAGGIASALLFIGLLVGAYDPLRVAALLDPPTELENLGASALRTTAARIVAEAAERDDADGAREAVPEAAAASPRPSNLEALARRGERAARAAGRGDRERALSELREIGRAGRARGARERDLARALRNLSEAVADRDASGRHASAARTSSERPSEALRLLARRARESERAGAEGALERQRTLARLSRAAEALEREAERDGAGGSRRAAEALREAAERMASGADQEAAAAALERAAAEVAAMERERREAAAEAQAMAELLEATGLLERAVQLAMMGRESPGAGDSARPGGGPGAGEGGGEGEGVGEGGSAQEMAELRRALAARLAAMGARPGAGPPGTGPGVHLPDRGGESRAAVEVASDIRARSRVGEGERAVQAVRGLGANGTPTAAYRDVFPGYAALAEEAIAVEGVPARRRVVVRRYFEGIRPGGGDETDGGDAEGSEP